LNLPSNNKNFCCGNLNPQYSKEAAMKRTLSLLAGIIFLLVFTIDVHAELDGFEMIMDEVKDPIEINADDQGNLWVSDIGNTPPNTGKILGMYPDQGFYEIYPVGGNVVDARHDGSYLWWADISRNILGRVSTSDGSLVHWEVPDAIGFYGTALDDQGRLWASGFKSSSLYRLDPDRLDKNPAELCKFTLPDNGVSTYLVVDGSDIWLGDHVNHRLLRMTISNNMLSWWPLPEDSYPSSMDMDEFGNIWFTDNINIVRLDPGSNILTTYPVSQGEFGMMLTIHEGIVWYTEQITGSIGRMDPNYNGNDSVVIQANAGIVQPNCSSVPTILFESPLDITKVENLTWENYTYPMTLDETGWQIYELPKFSVPIGIASTDEIWFVEHVRDVLGRVIPSAPLVHAEKTTSPTSIPETGGNVTFNYKVTNNTESPITITSLEDNIVGTLEGDPDCEIGTSLAAGNSCEFSIIEWMEGDYWGPHFKTVFTVHAQDASQYDISDFDIAKVTIINVPPSLEVTISSDLDAIPESGGEVTFTYVVKNISAKESVTITKLSDSLSEYLGETECRTMMVLNANESCEFTQSQSVPGDDSSQSFTNTFTATARDNDNSYGIASNSVTIDYTNVPPSISANIYTSTTSISENGGDVPFTYVVSNDTSENVLITDLRDDPFGPLTGDDDCKVGLVLASRDACSFIATFPVSPGDYPDSHVNMFTASVEDNEGSQDTATAQRVIKYLDALPVISVSKTAYPSSIRDTGEDVAFTFRVTNNRAEDVTINTLVDSEFNTLDGGDDCSVGTVLTANTSCEFTITRWLQGSASGPAHHNIFTATANDDEGHLTTDTDDETVTFVYSFTAIEATKTANPSSVAETGGNVTFTFKVKNTSSHDPITITNLNDSYFPNITGDDDCKVSTILDVGESCEFTLTNWITGDYTGSDHINVFSVTAVGRNDTVAMDTDEARVDFTNVIPAVLADMSTNLSSIPETGQNVTFTFDVKNISNGEPITIKSLNHSLFGVLSGDSDCKVGIILGPDESCDFSITRLIQGDFSGQDQVSTFNVTASDNDSTNVSDTDNVVISFTDVVPTILVTKTANPTTVLESGGHVTFTFTIQNTSIYETVWITSLSDDVFGEGPNKAIEGNSDCHLETELAPSESCKFTLIKWLARQPDGSHHRNIFTVMVEDNDGTTNSVSADAVVMFQEEDETKYIYLPLIIR